MSNGDLFSRVVGERRTCWCVAQVSEEGEYAVRQPTAHAVYENHRVRCFRQMLLGPLDNTEQLLNLGELMYQVSVYSTAKS